ncbi:MAG: hypothetical protein EOO45_04515 [Flavobacterium sp.]|nr:MAG: hypothetical protein EOO45_04515 [Flavobacterium sp.]
MKIAAFYFTFAVVLLTGCRKSDTAREVRNQEKTEVSQESAPAKSDDSLSPMESIKVNVAEINTGNSLSKKSYTFPCDETIKIDYYYNGADIFKTVVDYGTVGDHYQKKEFYYQNNKLIFYHDFVEGGPACEGCEMKLEKRWYIHSDKVIKYTENNKDKQCETCVFSANSLPYAILRGFKTGSFENILCK